MVSNPDVYVNLRNAVFSTPLVDTHEHLILEKDRISTKLDLFETVLDGYASSDLISSGMPPEDLKDVRNPELKLEDRWELLAPFWERIQNTGYALSLKIAFRDLYRIDELSSENCMKLAKSMVDRNRLGIYSWVLKEKAGIEHIILDTSTETPIEEVEADLFSPVMRFSNYIMVRSRPDIEALETGYGRRIHSLNDLVDALRTEFHRVHGKIIGVKIWIAYMRSLKFEKVPFWEAEEVFNNIFSQETFERVTIDGRRVNIPGGLSLSEAKPLQDFMVHKVIQLASVRDLPIQIHTGLQEGNMNIVTNSNPTLLINLFEEYEEVKFDIFHGSYPYTGELAALAKNFPNVYIDMCWLHIISPFRARNALSEWLDTVPSNKIFGFGGDYRFIEGVYGHSVLARENIVRVLSEKIDEGVLTEEQAVRIAERLLRINAMKFFLKKEG